MCSVVYLKRSKIFTESKKEEKGFQILVSFVFFFLSVELIQSCVHIIIV